MLAGPAHQRDAHRLIDIDGPPHVGEVTMHAFAGGVQTRRIRQDDLQDPRLRLAEDQTAEVGVIPGQIDAHVVDLGSQKVAPLATPWYHLLCSRRAPVRTHLLY